MADQEDQPPVGDRNPYASASRWRHQESTSYAAYAAAQRQDQSDTGALAEFLNSSRIDPETRPDTGTNGVTHTPIVISGEGRANTMTNEIVCGPLLNYRGMCDNIWRGSALIVVKGGGEIPATPPTLLLRRVGSVDGRAFVPMSGPDASPDVEGAQHIDGVPTADTVPDENAEPRLIAATCLYSNPTYTFWAFDLHVEMEASELKFEYTIPEHNYISTSKPRTNSFFVPASTESMRVMFHSCNGFSVGTDEEAWSGPALWNDVNRRHKEAPFHAMIGGGDQIYMDSIRVNGPLAEWTSIQNPTRRGKYPFPETLRKACDTYYLENYIRWYNTPPFCIANGQIPQLNIWDDHDIIDGFGSYTDAFMRCDVFRGIGGTAHKYYLLFQHHLPPPPSTYTTDTHATTVGGDARQGFDPAQVVDTYVAPSKTETEMGYILGPKPGPYVAEHSVSVYARLGARMAFLGIDARTERTRHQVNYPETYKLIFDRVSAELAAAKHAGQPITHLMILLGVPIAYPRLSWLENIFSSPLMGPAKFLNRRFGFGGSFFNKFDGSVDLLDDLDDHWTARTHKSERKYLIESLQEVAGAHNARITILSGDVHLAAVGRFYSDVRLRIPARADKRYMPNIISSAIVNKPPPAAVANLIAHRNKVHHLDKKTDETLLTFFDKPPGGKKKGAKNNHMTMPSRNYAILTENSPRNFVRPNAEAGAAGEEGAAQSFVKSHPKKKDGLLALHEGEAGSGTGHRAASSQHGKAHDGSLDICIRVEIDQSDSEGKTQGYGLTVPVLEYTAPGSSSSSSSSSNSGSRRSSRAS
ncbi:uncharacterized protein DNG_00672 [Cephalotrichum gorgonifer]|uniref:PhoD-like phosphatase domain-containing protein n=1 Tax=Cephalotrichum gorgonifer TaxID=2041049 RepID=A0AAE8MPJ2_9PEZI|nr:uncharacterized protein DNG_00672 [Cephalotrichum gorgonifer]